MKTYIHKLILAASLVFSLAGCEVLNQEPQSSITSDKAFQSVEAIQASLIGAYNALQSENYMGLRILLYPDLQGGNLAHTGSFPSFAAIAQRNILADNIEITNVWAQIYDGINRANNIITNVPAFNDPAFADSKNIVIAEARFLRAYHYFTLIRSWGDVPLVLTPTKVADASLQVSRNPKEDVYKQILDDLTFAIANLPMDFATGDPSFDVGRANKLAAYALKARVHLYRQEWTLASAAAASASQGKTLESNFLSIFEDQNTNESIWELQFSITNSNPIAFFLFSTARGGRNEMRPTTDLQNAFTVGDARRIPTVAFDSRLKYFRIQGNDNVVLFRLGEMILIQAEAALETGKLADAVTLINQIRNRAGLSNVSDSIVNDQAKLRDELFLQRRLELALEGHYYYDLIRTGRASKVLANYSNNQALWPIPQREMLANKKLIQNPGY